ncbi:MAG: HAMP domain-containing protein [Patescibacteria group bacterium]|nr:HAMP domain-containing protein [Patescibacteria group bacterium]
MNSLQGSLQAFNKGYIEQQLFLTLSNNTKTLSDSVKSYILTQNPVWETQFNDVSNKIDDNIQSLTSLVTTQKEKDTIVSFEKLNDSLLGTQLLILEKVHDKELTQAGQLFDSFYITRVTKETILIDSLVKNKNQEVSGLLSNMNVGIVFIRSFSLIVPLILFFLISFIAISFSEAISKSLQELITVVKKISAGNLTARALVTSHDEVGQLATAFNLMAGELRESYQNLESKVQSKTLELVEKVKDLEDAKKVTNNTLEKLKKEKDLAEKGQAKDDAILQSIGDGVIATDETGNVLFVNKVAEFILGIDSATSIGKHIFDLYTLYDEKDNKIANEKSPWTITSKTEEKEGGVFHYMRPENIKIAIEIICTPIKQKNKIIGYIEIVRDISKEKEIDRMKTEFISLASHQLRTPLSAIKWFSELMLNGDAGELTDEQKKFAINISESTDRTIDLVNSLLNISRIESGRILIDPKPTDLSELIKSILTELQPMIEDKRQKLLVSTNKDLPLINVDPKLIRQVYINLLTNAIKYTPEGGEISIFISQNGETVTSQVSDNGFGIPKMEQYKIFEKFFRAANAVRIETEGNGLGLYLVKSIIESSNGKIWFISEEGKGTSFFFTLPITGMKSKAGEVTLD